MAASNGGNVEGAVADQLVTTDNAVKIIGYTDLPGPLPPRPRSCSAPTWSTC